MSESEFNDLLCCPFCGGDAHITKRPGGFRVECTNRFSGCGINMRTHHHKTAKTACLSWNNRYDSVDIANQTLKHLMHEINGVKIIEILRYNNPGLIEKLKNVLAT